VMLHGRNAQGKTNLLEAVHLACTGRSLRSAQDAEMIRLGCEAAQIVTEVETQTRGRVELEVHLAPSGGRKLKLNGVAKRRQSDLIGVANVVTFTAGDLEIIQGEPAERRKLLNAELSALSASYYWNLTRYQRVLEQRNRLLRDLSAGTGRSDQLAPWDEQLIEFGAQLVARRWHLIGQLNDLGAATYQQLSGGTERMTLRYHPAVADGSRLTGSESEAVAGIAAALRQGLAERQQEERARATTLVGPHRDDFSVWIEEMDARTYASQGEQRTAAIALRLNLLKVVEQALGEPPLLLLDDVLSELDLQRQTCLLSALGHAEQILITSTEVTHLPTRPTAMVWRVEAGELTREDNASTGSIGPAV